MTTSGAVDAVVQLSFTVQSMLTRVAAEHDLSVTQLRLFGILRDRRPSMAAIAEHLDVDRSSVSGLVDRAERRGLVARRTADHDARVTTVELTAAGAALASAVEQVIQKRMDALLARVPAADRAGLFRIAEGITGD